jgi:hypothetical protein
MVQNGLNELKKETSHTARMGFFLSLFSRNSPSTELKAEQKAEHSDARIYGAQSSRHESPSHACVLSAWLWFKHTRIPPIATNTATYLDSDTKTTHVNTSYAQSLRARPAYGG